MTQRQNSIDIGKGISIILMVVGHTSIPSVLSNFIWAFHMPFFFLASGWVTNWEKMNFTGFLIRRSRQLLLPFLIYSLIVLVSYSFIGIDRYRGLLQKGWEGYALWFIPVLFVSSLLAKLVMTRNNVLQITTTILLVIVGASLRYFHISLPWTMCSVPYASALIIIGSSASKHVTFTNNLWPCIIGFAITAIISHFWRLDMAVNQIIPVIPLTLGALAGSMMVLNLSIIIEKYCWRFSKVFSYIGRETYVILAFSQIIILELKHFTNFGSILRYSILVLVLTIAIILKNGFNRLIGKKIL